MSKKADRKKREKRIIKAVKRDKATDRAAMGVIQGFRGRVR